MASQYSARHPFELPMAWEYSHMISGRSSPGTGCSAHSTIRSIGGYIGHTRSVTVAPRSRPNITAPS